MLALVKILTRVAASVRVLVKTGGCPSGKADAKLLFGRALHSELNPKGQVVRGAAAAVLLGQYIAATAHRNAPAQARLAPAGETPIGARSLRRSDIQALAQPFSDQCTRGAAGQYTAEEPGAVQGSERGVISLRALAQQWAAVSVMSCCQAINRACFCAARELCMLSACGCLLCALVDVVRVETSIVRRLLTTSA